MDREFFIGWEGKAPEETGRFLRKLTIGGLLVGLLLAIALPALQQTVAEDARFDYGNLQEFQGILVKDPVPMLIDDDGLVFYLVNPFKYGFDAELAERNHLQRVKLRGTRIWRGEEEMIEAVPETVEALGAAAGPNPLGVEQPLGEVTLKGEIVDSKCYLGVMNPGNLKPHRACAVNCIRGGIPPVLLLRDRQGLATYVLLVGSDGSSLNEEILDLVAEPVAVRGQLRQLGKRLILYADPGQIARE